MRLCLTSRGAEDTRALARALAAAAGDAAAAGFLVSLAGPLGAGKTVFAQGLAQGLGIEPDQVTSPTFVIVQSYAGGVSRGAGEHLHHVDLYRLEDPVELEGIGFFDLLEPGALVVVEWGDRFTRWLPADRLDVRIDRVTTGAEAALQERRIEARAGGARAERVLERWSGFEAIRERSGPRGRPA